MNQTRRNAMRWHAVLIGLCLAAYTTWTVVLMYTVPATHDEATYIRAGHIVSEEGWGGERTYFHGPLPLLLTRLVPPPAEEEAPYRMSLFRARLGTLCFGWLAGACCYLMARRAYGPRAGLLALSLYALNPLVLAYGALATVDLAQAAGIALVLLWLQSYAAERTPWRIALIGGALGLSFSLKYLSLLFGPPVALVVGLLAWYRRRASHTPLATRGRDALLAVTLLILSSLLALHAACGFQTGFARMDVELYRSEFVRGLAKHSVISFCLQPLPQGVVSGLDAYYWTWRASPPIFLNGNYAPSHPTYFLWSFLLKVPEWVWLLAALGFIRAWVRPTRSGARLGWIFVGVLLPPLAYLSLAHGSQLGIRYALALLVPLLIIASNAARWMPHARPRSSALALLILCLLSAGENLSRHPHLLGYFSRSAGGPRAAHRYFDGSNCDWGQLRQAGLQELRTSEAMPFEALTRGDGPRLGRVAIYIEDRHAPHPLDAARSRHWLDAFQPLRNIGAAWWLYDITREDFQREEARGMDPLLIMDRAIAELGANQRERVLDLWPQLSAPLQTQMEAVLDLSAALETMPFDVETAMALRRAWLALGRRDRARELLREERLAAFPGCFRAEAERLLPHPEEARAFLDDLLAVRPEALDDESSLLLLLHLTSAEHYYARTLEILSPRLDRLSPATQVTLQPLIATWQQRAAEVEAGFAPR